MRIDNDDINLLTILAETPETTTVELAQKINVSTKTIQRQLSNLQETMEKLAIDIQLTINPSKGVKLEGDYNQLPILIQRLKRLSVDDEKDRLFYIVSVLLNATEPVTLQTFSDEMHIARSTVEKSVNDARSFLSDFSVEIRGTRKGLSINADESLKRSILSELIRQYWHGIVVNIDNPEQETLDISLNSQLIPAIESTIIDQVQQIVYQFMKDNQLSLTEYQYQSLVIHSSIMIDRIQKDYYVKQSQPTGLLNKLTIKLILQLEETFSLHIPSNESQYLDIYIEGIANSIDDSNDTVSIMETEEGGQLVLILEEFLAYLEPDQELLQNLTVHLNTSLKRLKKGIRIRNPYKDKIISTYSTAFNLAVELAVELSAKFNLVFNIDEITYIAIHIQSFFERQKDTKIDVVLVCLSGFGTVKLLEQRIIQQFGDIIRITDVIGIAQLNEINKENQLIISTIPIESTMKNVITVSPLLTKSDIQHIREHIESRLNNATNSVFRLMNSDLIFHSNGRSENWMTVIESIVSQLIYRGYADVGLLESAIERERLSSTALENFSMPHGEIKYINKSVISVYVNPNGIQWGKRRVDAVFFFALNPKEEKDINLIYKEFNNLISNEEWFQQMIKIGSREELQRFLLKEGKE